MINTSEIRQTATILASEDFKNKVRKSLEETGILRTPITLSKIDSNLRGYFNDEIEKLEEEIKKSQPEKLIELQNKSQKRIKELEDHIEYLRKIYKRDVKEIDKRVNQAYKKGIENGKKKK